MGNNTQDISPAMSYLWDYGYFNICSTTIHLWGLRVYHDQGRCYVELGLSTFGTHWEFEGILKELQECQKNNKKTLLHIKCMRFWFESYIQLSPSPTLAAKSKCLKKLSGIHQRIMYRRFILSWAIFLHRVKSFLINSNIYFWHPCILFSKSLTWNFCFCR